MADFTTHLKKAMWTEAEVGVMLAGSIAAVKFLDDKKIFKDQFAKNPAWFTGSREGAPFYIKWSGGLKAVAALTAASYVKNPWIRLALMGVAFHGSLQQLRVLTYDKEKQKDRIDQIGQSQKSQAELDAELKRLASEYRENLAAPDYVGQPLTDRYQSAVAGLTDRYKSAVAGNDVFDETNPMIGGGFSLMDSDMSWAA